MAGVNWTDVLRGKGNTLGGKNKPQANSRRPKPVKTEEEELLEVKLKRLEALNQLQLKFNKLLVNFIEPNHLDFQRSTSLPPTPSTSTSTSTSTLTIDNLKLSFTSNNASFLAYEDSLTRLLIELDGVESGGDEEVRNSRKNLVKEIEAELEHLEGIKKSEFMKLSNQDQGGRAEEDKSLSELKDKKNKVDTLLAKMNGFSQKTLPSLPKRLVTPESSPEDQNGKSEGGNLKRTDDGKGRGSPISGAKEFAGDGGRKQSNGTSEDRYSKSRRQDTNYNATVASNDSPLFARLPSRFD